MRLSREANLIIASILDDEVLRLQVKFKIVFAYNFCLN